MKRFLLFLPSFSLFFVFVLFPLSPAFGAPPTNLQETSESLFLRSGSYQAMQEGRFQDALSEIEVLAKTRRNDPYLLKMRGICLVRLNRFDEAQKSFRAVLKLNPLDRGARYYLAQVYATQKDHEKAKGELRFILENPDIAGHYEDKAQRALAVIEGRRIEKPKKEEKRWKVFGTYGYEYDDNAILQSSVKNSGAKAYGDRNANRFTIKNGLGYDYLRDQKKKLGVSYTFSQSLHDDSLEDFNFRNHVLQHYGSYSTNLLGRPASLGLKYTFSHGTLQASTFSSANTLLPYVAVEVIDNLILSFYDNMSFINFRNKGSSEAETSRDGFYNTTGAMTTLYFSERRRSVSVSYEFGYNQTEGDNFDARINAIRTTFKTPLVEKVSGEASFSIVDDRHYNYSSLPRRKDIRYDVGGKLIRPLNSYVETRLFYSFTKVHNAHAGLLGQFQYARHIFGAEVSFTY